ncbi:PREDICTED: uncharacterized protein LOC106808638 [Priapulus caudatus]|uniref:Uncharacterized protein LOC106808638 n=1 Tax=Priapulus caudatus TaxID=37621 RepID=A0ABM1E409_PRICU|nr:PREDICTED: uncharacterized protein LOC106808638 [Priapulus caudatus]
MCQHVWVELGGRHDNKDSKYRGELEVRLTCIVRNHTEASPEQGKLKKAAAVGSSIFNVANSVGNKLNTLARRAAPSVQVSHDNVHDAREVQDDVITQVEDGHASSLFRKKSWIKKKSAKQAVPPVVSDISLDTKNVSSGKNMLSKWQPDIIRRRVSEHRMSLLDLTRLKSAKSKSLERHNSDLSDRGRRATIVGFPGEPCYARGVGRCGSVGDVTFMNRNVSKDGRRQDPQSCQVKPRRERLRTLVEAGARRHSLCSASSSDSEEVLRLVDAPDVTHTNAFAHFQQEQAVPLIPDEIISTYANMGREELLKIVCHQWSTIEKKAKLVHALEDYIDDLLVKVIETTPRILQMADEKTKATKAHAERHHSIV